MEAALPMFPLSGVHFPHTLIPLRVFEQRYLLMMQTCLAGDGRFGVVLIERGSEVGGGDTRFNVGTLVEIRAVSRMREGTLAVVGEGLERIGVRSWLRDDPFPQALVSMMSEPEPGAEASSLVDEAHRAWQRMLALASELGVDTHGADLELPQDALAASYLLAAVAPVGPLDAQRLLQADGAEARLRLLIEAFGAEAAMMRAELGSG